MPGPDPTRDLVNNAMFEQVFGTTQVDGRPHQPGVPFPDTMKGDIHFLQDQRSQDRARIDELAAELTRLREASEWVPVGVRLPEAWQKVLVSSNGRVYTDEYRDGEFYHMPCVTHWLPLPSPPKEGS